MTVFETGSYIWDWHEQPLIMSGRFVNLTTVEIPENRTIGNLLSSAFGVSAFEFDEPNVSCDYWFQRLEKFMSNCCANRAAVCSR